MSEPVYKIEIPLSEAIKMEFYIESDKIMVQGKRKTLKEDDIQDAQYILLLSFYGEPWASSYVKTVNFESDHFEEDLDEVTTKLLGISHYSIMLGNFDYDNIFKEKCRYFYSIEE